VPAAAETCWAGAHGLVSLLITQREFEWSREPQALKALMFDTLFHGLLVD
jgi:hypothetical protein